MLSDETVTVRIPGTNISTTTDDSGFYTLNDATQGQLELLFSKGNTINYLPVGVESNRDSVYVQDVRFATSRGSSDNEISFYPTSLQSFTITPVDYSDTIPPPWYSGRDFGAVSYFTVTDDKETEEAPLPVAGLRKIFIRTGPAGADITEDLQDFPLGIRLTEEHFDFDASVFTGENVSFIDSLGQRLNHEIEYWNSMTKSALFWVLVPHVAGANDEQYILMKWGDSALSETPASGTVFSSTNNYRGVWHLDNSLTDATEFANHGADLFTTPVYGILGPARSFSRDNSSHIQIPNTTHFNIEGQITVSAWVQFETPGLYWDPIVAKGGDSFRLHRTYDFEGASFSVTAFDDTLVHIDARGETPVTDGGFHFLVGVRDADSIRIYVNGILDTSTAHNGLLTWTNDELLMIGKNTEHDTRNFEGIIDEVRVSDTARSPEWIRLCYETQREEQVTVVFE